MPSDFRVGADVLEQSLRSRAAARSDSTSPFSAQAARMCGPSSRLRKGLVRARSALTGDEPSLKALNALVSMPSFQRLGAALQHRVLSQTLSVPHRDDNYVADVSAFFEMGLDWPEGSVKHMLAQLERHAAYRSARSSLLKFASLKVSSVLALATRMDLMTYLSGPSDGSTTSNRDSLQKWWNRRRHELLKMLARLRPQPTSGLEDAVANFIELPARPLSLVQLENTKGGIYGILLGRPADPQEYAYFTISVMDRSDRRQVRLHATHPLDRKVVSGRTFQAIQSALSRREEFAFVSWVQENHWIGEDWDPGEGNALPPGVLRNMHEVFSESKQMAVTLAASREALQFHHTRLRNGQRIQARSRVEGMSEMMAAFAA